MTKICPDCGKEHSKGKRCIHCSLLNAVYNSPSQTIKRRWGAAGPLKHCKKCIACGFPIKTHLRTSKKVVKCPCCGASFQAHELPDVLIERKNFIFWHEYQEKRNLKLAAKKKNKGQRESWVGKALAQIR